MPHILCLFTLLEEDKLQFLHTFMNLNMNQKTTFFLLYVSTILGIPLEQKLVLASGNVTDQLALLAFKDEITADPFAALSSWNGSLHFCQWDGVTCSKRHQRVVMLSLEGKGLAGPLSPSIGNLSFLSVLNLGDNFFNGDIPKEVGNLFRLQVLNLSSNAFTGEIPTPANLGSLEALENLNLDFSRLANGGFDDLSVSSALTICSSLQNLIVSQKIYLALSNVHFLKLGHDTFNGALPLEVGNLKELVELDISDNRLSAGLPGSLAQTMNLSRLNFHLNLKPPSLRIHILGSAREDLNLDGNLCFLTTAFLFEKPSSLSATTMFSRGDSLLASVSRSPAAKGVLISDHDWNSVAKLECSMSNSLLSEVPPFFTHSCRSLYKIHPDSVKLFAVVYHWAGCIGSEPAYIGHASKFDLPFFPIKQNQFAHHQAHQQGCCGWH
ncbi:Leucine-rich repeat-containing N-terminal, plant-type [Dillenia turbinata]|uniref:Leucine-rich repeat-containing N-terminal, plant-type n=1 Tax=Dillenia turbinata TaxID=194707 RepID=A0AAN8ZC05_9MAGN